MTNDIFDGNGQGTFDLQVVNEDQSEKFKLAKNEPVTRKERGALRPDHYLQQDFFIADILDVVPKADQACMAFPIFSLSKKPETETKVFKDGDNWIRISPSKYGFATIFDRDILLFCISQCMDAKNNGRQISKKIRFETKNLMATTNRQNTGQGYKLLKNAFLRLRGTLIETNITNGGEECTDIFGLIDSARIINEADSGRIIEMEVKLPDWIFDAITHNNVLTLNRSYFLLHGALERRLYEFARKFCGDRYKYSIELGRLKKLVGSSSSNKEFKRQLKKIIDRDFEKNYMPDFNYAMYENKKKETVILIIPKENYINYKKKYEYSLKNNPELDREIIESVRKYTINGDTRTLVNDWKNFIKTEGIVLKNPAGHFLDFVKKRYNNSKIKTIARR